MTKFRNSPRGERVGGQCDIAFHELDLILGALQLFGGSSGAVCQAIPRLWQPRIKLISTSAVNAFLTDVGKGTFMEKLFVPYECKPKSGAP